MFLDPLSFSSGMAGLLSLTIEITKISYAYIAGVKNAPKSALMLISEVTSLENILRDLRNKVVLHPGVIGVLESLQLDETTRVHVLQQCETDLRSTLRELQENLNASRSSAFNRLQWPFKEPDIQKKLERLRWLQNQLTALTTHNTLAASALTYKEVKDWRNENSARKILDWLSPLDFGAKQHDVLMRWHPRTVQWLLDLRVFKEWLEEDFNVPERRTLWCAGHPGAGKTVATSVIIAHLIELGRAKGFGIAYAYCNYDDQISQTPAKLLGCLVKQLSSQLSSLPDFFNVFSNAHRTSPPTTDDCLSLLKQLSTHFPKIFLLIDGLDEAENSPQKHRAELLEACSRIAQIGNSTRLLVSSRPYLNDIRNTFATASRIDVAASDNDLQRFIRARIETNDDLQDILEYDEQFKEHIIADVLEKSAGQFLLPALHIERLNDLTCKEDIEEILKDVTSSVEETYKKTFNRMKNKSKPRQELAENVLLWLSYTKRPLRFEELQEAVAYRWNEDEEEISKKSLAPRKIILEACLGLVIEETQSGTIKLVHHTLEQAFKAHHRSRVDPEAFIGRSLLSYLSRKVITQSSQFRYDDFSQALLRQCPLLPYAFHFWNEHARSSQDLFEKAILDYFSMRPKTLPIPNDPFQRSVHTDLLKRDPPVPAIWEDLFYAVVLQLDQIVRRLVQRGANPFAYYVDMGCPSILTWICCQYMDTIQSPTLLQKTLSEIVTAIFQPDHIALAYTKAHPRDQVYMAIIFPHLTEAAMTLVLQKGFDVNRIHRFPRPTEFVASFRGHRAAASAIHIAAFFQSPNAIKLLVQIGADVGRKAFEGQTALEFCLRSKYTIADDRIAATVRELLEAGADAALEPNASSLVMSIPPQQDVDSQAKYLVEHRSSFTFHHGTMSINLAEVAKAPLPDVPLLLNLMYAQADASTFAGAARPLLENVSEDQVSIHTASTDPTVSTESSNLTGDTSMSTLEAPDPDSNLEAFLQRRRAKSHVRRIQYQSTSGHSKLRQDSFRQDSTDALNRKILFETVEEDDMEIEMD